MKKKIIIPIVLVVLLIISGAFFFLSGKDNKKADKKNDETELKIPENNDSSSSDSTKSSVNEEGFLEEEETIGSSSSNNNSEEPVEEDVIKSEEGKEESNDSNESRQVSEETKQAAIQLVNRAFDAAKPINASPDGYGDLTNYAANYNYGQKYALNDWIASTGYNTSFDPSSLEIEPAHNEGNYLMKFNIVGNGQPIYKVKAYYIQPYDQMQLQSVQKTKNADEYITNQL